MSLLHVIEGFFGRPWSWEARRDYAPFLRAAGYGSYIYAPKDDAFLRARWQEPWPLEVAQEIERLVATYHGHDLQFGIGLSPMEIYREFTGGARARLGEKVATLNALGVDTLCLLFDDMRGDMPGLARAQVDVAHFVAAHTVSARLVLCPTYYSCDPVLEKAFGAMPSDYWETLGKRLDPDIALFWTGPRVCSNGYTAAHLEEVGGMFQRKPFLWDNYPVNDSEKMSQFLHLRAFTRREAASTRVSGHAVNPMNQPSLSKIPLLTLAACYRDGADYSPDEEFKRACLALGGDALAEALVHDVAALQDEGLLAFSGARRAELKQRFKVLAKDPQAAPYAREVIAWLDGEYAFDPACLTG